MAQVTYATAKKCFSLLGKVDRQSVLQMSFSSEFQTLGAATLKAHLAVSVCVLGTNRCSATIIHTI